MVFDTAGVKQNSGTLEPSSFPSACSMTSSFAANKWYQVSLSVTAALDLKYALDLTILCSDTSGLPGATLDALKLFSRASAQSSPSKITVSNLRLIRRSIDDLISSGDLQATRKAWQQTTYLATLFQIPFVNEYIPALKRENEISLNTLGNDVLLSFSQVAVPSQRTYFSIGTASNGLIRWNSNPRYTDWFQTLPGTKEIWIYMDTSTGFTFAGNSWIFHMESSLALRINDPTGEIGCSHTKDSTNSFSTFVSHFPSFIQYNVWNHLVCVFQANQIDFGYNEHFKAYPYSLSITHDYQTANDRFSFGFPVSMPIYFHEARVWRSARSHGQIVKYLYSHIESYQEPQLMLYLLLNEEGSDVNIFDASRSSLHNSLTIDTVNHGARDFSWSSSPQESPYLCPQDWYTVQGECVDTMRVYNFDASIQGYFIATQASILDNNPQTEGAYEMWIWPNLVNQDSYLFEHEQNGGGGLYASLKMVKSTRKLVFNSPFTSNADVTTTAQVTEQSWHHIAVSMETTNINFIIDSTTEKDTSGVSFATPTSGNFNIGFSSTQTSSEYGGQMLEVRVWKTRSVHDLLTYAHTQAISIILSQVSSSSTSLVSYWPLLPEYSPKIYDMSISANHIDLSSAASTYSVVSVHSGLNLCRGIQIFTGTQCTERIYAPIFDQQIQADATITLTLPDHTLFSVSFFIYRSSASTSPTDTIMFLQGNEITLEYDITTSKLMQDLCGAALQITTYTLPTDKWVLVTQYINAALSFSVIDKTVDVPSSGTSSCNTPLPITFLPTSAVYDGIYLRDFMVYGKDMHPNSLKRMHHFFELPSRSLIDVHFPLSIAELSLKNIAHNPETIDTVQYNEINRYPAIYALQTAGDIDMYRWRYEPGLTDIPTLCESGYRLVSNQCIFDCGIQLSDTILPASIRTAIQLQQIAFTMWFYYNQPIPSGTETFVTMEEAASISMVASFSASGTDIVLDFFQSSSTHTIAFSEFSMKWHFFSLYREDNRGGYAYDGVEKHSTSTLVAKTTTPLSVNIGITAANTNPYLGVMSRFSIHQRESAAQFQSTAFHAEQMLLGLQSAKTKAFKVYHFLGEPFEDRSKIYVTYDHGSAFRSHLLPSGSSFVTIEGSSPLEAFIQERERIHPKFTNTAPFTSTAPISSIGTMSVWILTQQSNAGVQFILKIRQGPTSSDNVWLQLSISSTGHSTCYYGTTSLIKFSQSVKTNVWQYYQISVETNYLYCIQDDEQAQRTHSETTPTLSPPVEVSLTPYGTAAILFRNLRFFQDASSGFNKFSYYKKLSHKRLHNYSKITMNSVAADLDFLYLGTREGGDQYFTLYNFAQEDTQTDIVADKIEMEGPTMCNYDQIYNGIECISDYKQLYVDQQHQQLKLIISPVQGMFTATGWVLISELVGPTLEQIIFFHTNGANVVAGMSLVHATGKFQFYTSTCTGQPQQNELPPIGKWFFLDIQFSFPSIEAHISLSSTPLQCSDNCFAASDKFEKVVLMGQGTTRGSFKQFSLISFGAAQKLLLQMRAGLIASPYEDNNLVNYYYLDQEDVSYNQERVFNHAKGSWDPIYLGIPTATNVNKFVDPAVTTRQRYEELPSCSNEKGLYLEPVFLVCRTIEHYAYSVIGSSATVLPLPELRDAGKSWTLSFWIYIANDAAATIYEHKDSSANMKHNLQYNANYGLQLQDSTSSIAVSLAAGFFFNGKWNIMNVVCSEPLLEDKCQMFPNFSRNSAYSASFIDLLFLDNQVSTLEMSYVDNFHFFSRVRAWSSVVGGTLAQASDKLKEGAYSLTQSGPNLRVFFSLTNGDITDSVTGNNVQGIVDAQFSYYWVPTNFGGIVQEQFAQCILPQSQQVFTTDYSSEIPEGFTVRIWYRLTTHSATSVLLENTNNFQIAKQLNGHYQVTQFIHDSNFPDYSMPAQSMLLTTGFWDMFVYKLDKVKSTVLALSYNYGDIKYNQQGLSNQIDWTLNPVSTQFLISDASASICVREVSYRSSPVEFATVPAYFTESLTSTSKGTVFYLSPIHYQGTALSTDKSIQEISFCPSATLMCEQESKVLTVKPSSNSAPSFTISPAGDYSEFTVMLLYKISTGAITGTVNLVQIPSNLLVTFQTGNTQATLGSCSFGATFTAGVDQGDWLPLGVTYDGATLKMYRYGEVHSSACAAQPLTAVGTLSLSQQASGVDISYAYVYLFSEWLTPGEVLYYSFRKLPYYYTKEILITGYEFYNQDPSVEVFKIRDMSGSFEHNFSTTSSLQWDSTTRLNGGTAPAVSAANPELQMCEDGEVWSKGGNCFSQSRTLSLTSDPSISFAPVNQGQYSFVVWLKMEGGIQNAKIIKFFSGQTEVTISAIDQKINWFRGDGGMLLSHDFPQDTWVQAGGYYNLDGVMFFANQNTAFFNPTQPVTGIMLDICESLNLSSSRLRLYLVSIWNLKQSINTLKSTSGNRVHSRANAVVYLQFNFLFQSAYPNWVDPSSSITNDLSLYEASTNDSGIIPMSSTCSLGAFVSSSQCIVSDRFLCFAGSQSPSTTPLDATSLSIDVLSHSIIAWFSISPEVSMTGSVDIKFGQDCFQVSLTSAGAVSISYGGASILPSTSISNGNKWHLLKASIRSVPQTLFQALVIEVGGAQIAQVIALNGLTIPASPSMTSFSIESSLTGTGGRVCISYLSLYPYSLTNQATSQISTLSYSPLDSSKPSFVLQINRLSYISELVSSNALVLQDSALTFIYATGDVPGDAQLACLLRSMIYDTSDSTCKARSTVSSCTDPNAVTCSASGFSFECLNGFVNEGGVCINQCTALLVPVTGYCFPQITISNVEYTLSLNPDNTFSIVFDAPITQAQYDEVAASFNIQLTSQDRTNLETSEPTLTPTYQGAQVESFNVDWTIASTIRSKDKVNLAVDFTINDTVITHPETQIVLNTQQNPEFKEELQALNNAVQFISPSVQAATSFAFVQVLLTDGALKYLWALVNASQLMAVMPLIDVPVPPNVMIIFNFMAIANGDFGFLESLPNVFKERQLVDYDTLQQQPPLNENFEFTGYESGSFFLLQELKFVLLTFYIAFLLPVIIISAFLTLSPRCASIRKRLLRFYECDFWIRLVLELYLDILLTTLIASYTAFSNLSNYTIDVALTILAYIILSFFAVFVTVYLCKHRSFLKSSAKQWRGKALTQDLGLSDKHKRKNAKLMYYPSFLIERILYSLILVFFRSSPLIAGCLCLALFVGGLLYLTSASPLESKLQLGLQMVSKVTLIVLVCCMIYLHLKGDATDERSLMNVGYAMIGVILLNVAINLIVLIVTAIISTLLFMKKCCCKKSKDRYRVDPKTKETELEFKDAVKCDTLQDLSMTQQELNETRFGLDTSFESAPPSRLVRKSTVGGVSTRKIF